MELAIDESILQAYGLTEENINIQQIGSGLINGTYLLTNLSDGKKFVLQQINTNVFTNPEAIADNIAAVADFLKANFPTYLFPAPLATVANQQMCLHENKYWRLMPFIEGTVALDTLSTPKQAFEAAKQFGKLSRLLNNFDSSKLQPTIIGFHDLALRFEQFKTALSKALVANKDKAVREIQTAFAFEPILTTYLELSNNADFPNRVMHHDTKISNTLLDKDTFEGICVIDLDTLMPGKFISDLGDMMRTYLCEFSENEKDISKITIRINYFSAMMEGYLSEMGEILTKTEKELILFSGKYMIYLQALRFLTDFLNDNIYYAITYPEQNLDRARNQFKLLEELFRNEIQLQQLIGSNLVSK